MTTGPKSIDIDYDALSSQIAALTDLADDLTSAIEAGKSTQGMDAAHAFGLLCSGMNGPGTLVSNVVTTALGLSKQHLESVAQRERSGLNDFCQLEDQIQEVVQSGMNALDHVPGRAI